jgi:hypothetical protein
MPALSAFTCMPMRTKSGRNTASASQVTRSVFTSRIAAGRQDNSRLITSACAASV